MIRKLARPMLASVYIADGVNTVKNASEHANDAERVVKTIKSVLPSQYAQFIPSDPETVAKINGGVKIGAGSTFALGKAPRLSASLLAASTVGTLLGRNAFWDAKDSDDKARRRNGAMTNVALLGGVLLASADTEGKPGLAWRAQDAAKRANKNIQQALPTQSETDKAKKKAGEWFQNTAETVSERAHEVADQVTDYVDDNKGRLEEDRFQVRRQGSRPRILLRRRRVRLGRGHLQGPQAGQDRAVQDQAQGEGPRWRSAGQPAGRHRGHSPVRVGKIQG